MKYLLNKNWKISYRGKSYTADSPCTVLSVLLDNKVIEDPYYRCNEEKARSFLYDDYSFENTFVLTEEDLTKDNYLCFDRLCTIADIYLNDEKIGEARSMHQRYKYKLNKDLLRRENKLRIEFKSSYNYIENYPNPENLFETYAVTHKDSPKIRQANYMFGWDWGPSLADMGILGDVYLLSSSIGYLNSFRHNYEFLENKVKVHINLELIDFRNAEIEVSLKGFGYENKKNSRENRGFYFEIDNPKLWYPAGFGEQNLYSLEISLVGKETLKYEYKIGIRKIEIDDSFDKFGRNFALYVNSVKIFLKGSNYVPEDSLLTLTNKQRTERLLKLARDFNHNCIRVWGGSYYPDDYFYETCDELGLLVFQDLMFACASYNISDNNFKNIIVDETKDSLKRIRHHASLFIISGNNEIEDGVRGHGFKPAVQYLEMFHNILKNIVEQETDFYYLSSSPTSGEPYFSSPNDTNFLDTHYWWVWGCDRDVEDYLNIQPRLLSEFGMQSFSTIDTTKSFAGEDDLAINSEVMISHQKDPAKTNNKIANYVFKQFKKTDNFREFSYLSMLTQAEGIKLCIDHLRCHKERCNGALYWQLNDCWPTQSCSSVDYLFGLKALHYYSKKFFAQDLVAFEKGKKLNIFISNDSAKKQKYNLVSYEIDNNFDNVNKETTSLEVNAYSSALAKVISNYESNYGVVAELYDVDNNLLSRNIYRNKKDKDYEYPEIKVSVKKLAPNKYEISANNFVRSLYLNPHNNRVIFSDNFFDLLKGETKVVSTNIDINPSDIEIMYVH